MAEDFCQECASREAIQAADFVTGWTDPNEAVGSPSQITDIVPSINASPGSDTVPSTGVSLSKKRRTIPEELPNAKLYLEDVEEIASILLETYGQASDGYKAKPSITYTIGDEEFPSLGALAARGGVTRELRISISDSYSKSVRITKWIEPRASLSGLSEEIQWMAYGRLTLIFESRGYRFKNAVSSLPTWLKWAIYGA
jgi:hypothetical protein